jgi:hypothetical protein
VLDESIMLEIVLFLAFKDNLFRKNIEKFFIERDKSKGMRQIFRLSRLCFYFFHFPEFGNQF